MSVYYNDGNLPYGSRLIHLTGSVTGAYVATDISVTRAVRKVQRYDEVGSPDSAIYFSEWDTVSATLQLANTGSAIPVPGGTFAVTFNGSTVEKWVIDGVTQSENNLSEKKVSITASEVVN